MRQGHMPNVRCPFGHIYKPPNTQTDGHITYFFMEDDEILVGIQEKECLACAWVIHRITHAMINDCFRHQHPEAYGRSLIPDPMVPQNFEHRRDHLVVSPPSGIHEEQGMRNPGAQSLDPE